MTDVARAKFRVILEVDQDGPKLFECGSYSANWAVNKIPSATVTLGTGRDVRTLEPSPVHTAIDTFTYMRKVRVILLPRGEWEPGLDESWDGAGELPVFVGRITGAGFRKVRGNMVFSVHLIHWLADLSFASVLSEQSHPANAALWNWRSVFTASGQRSTLDKPNFVTETIHHRLFTPGRISSDLWAQAIQPMFCDLAGRKPVRIGDAANCLASDTPNQQTLDALKRIEGNSDCGATPSPYYAKMSLDLGSAEALVARSFASWMSRQLIESYWSTTIWDKLINDIAPHCQFHIVPKVESAQIVPLIPGLRDTYQKQLRAEDFKYLDMTAMIPRPLRAMGIVAGALESRNGGREYIPIPRLGGCFSPGEDALGMIMIQNAPGWLANVPASAHLPSRSTGVPKRRPTSTATTPQAPGTEVGDEDGHTPGSGILSAHELYQAYAHAQYVKEMLRGRFGVIHGKLRFDIAPGSNVLIKNSGDVFIGDDILATTLVGTVVRVTVAIQSDGEPNASTTFQLAHLRTELENENEATSIASHPLYQGAKFTGAPLVHEYLFPDE